MPKNLLLTMEKMRNFAVLNEYTDMAHFEQHFQALFHFATIGMVLTNQKGEIVMINEFANTQFGYEKGELNGKGIEVLIPRDYSHKHRVNRENYMSQPQNRSMGAGLNLFGLRKDETKFPVEISLSSFEIDEEKFTIAFIIDVTQMRNNENTIRKQNEALGKLTDKLQKTNEELELRIADRTKMLQESLYELEKSRSQLENALKREKDLSDLKTRFVSTASHEFRTPLSTILSSTELIHQYAQKNDPTKIERHMHRIKSAVNNLTNILDDFLSVGKLEEGKVEPNFTHFDISDLTSEMVNEMLSVAKTGQKLVYSHEGNKRVFLDPKLTRNILYNMISNAIKYSHENSKITISSIRKDDCIRLIIRDEGMGISKEDLQHLYQRFFRGTNVTNIQGTGLGLHIVSQYIELMQGRISCESELNKGTTFTLIFPQ